MKKIKLFRVSMPQCTESFQIESLFDPFQDATGMNQNYADIILSTLKKILPATFFENREDEIALLLNQKKILQECIPIITFSEAKQIPGVLSFFAFSRYRPNAFKFFFEMISRWLTPGQRLNVVLVYASDFRLKQLSDEIFTICEIKIQVKDVAEFEEIKRNFPIIGTEITLGIHSEFYSQRILEIKGLSADDKTAYIQDFITYLVERFPKAYDHHIFTEMQHVLVTCRDDFKVMRQSKHLIRIICVQYLFRKALKEAIKKKSHRRHLNLKIFRATLTTQKEKKKVLGVLVGVNFLREQEAFGEQHLIKALQHFLPNILPVENSFFIHKLSFENISLFYIEIEKKDGQSFTTNEIKKLRKELPANLKNRVEHRLHRVFMPRNEEEVMRNILTLTNQLKFVRDIPQVFINFEEQAHSHLYFIVILARVLKPNTATIAQLFQTSNTCIEYIPDRIKEMGFVRKKYIKEAAVFRVSLRKEGFLRTDHSIDLYKARQVVANELTKVFGDIRDYNGGMISKQHELLSAIQLCLTHIKDYDEFLLENFFYSLSPVTARTLLEPQSFKTLFLMLVEGIKEYKQEGYYLKISQDATNAYALIIVEDLSLKEILQKNIQQTHLFSSRNFSSASVKTHGNMCLGYIYKSFDQQKRAHFFQMIEQALSIWQSNHCS